MLISFLLRKYLQHQASGYSFSKKKISVNKKKDYSFNSIISNKSLMFSSRTLIWKFILNPCRISTCQIHYSSKPLKNLKKKKKTNSRYAVCETLERLNYQIGWYDKLVPSCTLQVATIDKPQLFTLISQNVSPHLDQN